MAASRLAFVLTLINLVILGCVGAGIAPSSARESATVLRGRGLEIVDDAGRVRASIVVYPAATHADGTWTGDAVVLRLIDPKGGPGVKIANGEEGAGAAFVGEQGTYAQILSSRDGSVVRVTNKDGRVRALAP